MNFQLGDLVIGYNDEHLPCKGKISSFKDDYLRLDNKELIKQDTAHKLPILEIHVKSKELFLASASQCSPCLYFKDAKARRDYLEALWETLCRYHGVTDS